MPIISTCYIDYFDYLAVSLQDKKNPENNSKIDIWNIQKINKVNNLSEFKSSANNLLWD